MREFNRFYTRQIGLLQEGYLESPFSLTQVRVLYELAHRAKPTASELARELGLDRGYLSRMLRAFQRRGLLARETARGDGRQQLLSLTRKGRQMFAPLDARAHAEVGAVLRRLPAAQQERIVGAMATIQGLLRARPAKRVRWVVRRHREDDMDWVVRRHGTLYAQEFGWDESFRDLVAGIVTGFVRDHDPKRERCWIAELEGRRAGSVFCVKRSPTVAQLRLLLVEPRARGLGIGTRLVDECVRFARSAGYRRMMLWTNDVLVPARRIYEAAGFHLVEEERHHSFGHDLVGQTWALKL